MKNIKILLFLMCMLQVNIYGMFANRYNKVEKSLSTIKKPYLRTNQPIQSSSSLPLVFQQILVNNKKTLEEENETVEDKNNGYIPISLPKDESDLNEINNIPIIKKFTRENGEISPANNFLQTQNSSSNITSIDSSVKQSSSNNKEYLLDFRQRKKNSEISHFRNKLSSNVHNTIFTTNDLITICDFIIKNPNENLTNLPKFFRNLAEQKIKINSVLLISLNPELTHFKCLHKTNRACNSECEKNKISLIKKLNNLKTEVVDEKYITLIGLQELSEPIIDFIKPEIEEAKEQILNAAQEEALKQKENEHKQALSTAVEETTKKYVQQIKQIRTDYEQSLKKIEDKHNATFALTLCYILAKRNEDRKKLETIFTKLNRIMEQKEKEYNETLQQKETESKKNLEEKENLLKENQEKLTKKSRWYRRYPIPILSFFLGGFTFHIISNPTPYIPYFCLFLKGLSSFLRFFAPSKKASSVN